MSSQQSQKPGAELPREPLLLAAALAGLLCLTQACSAEEAAPVDAAGVAGAAGAPGITSSEKVANLDAAGFKALCDARSGTVEVMAHCGGLASARGFAYDTTTQVLSEHTCRGANTCAGWNCVTSE